MKLRVLSAPRCPIKSHCEHLHTLSCLSTLSLPQNTHNSFTPTQTHTHTVHFSADRMQLVSSGHLFEFSVQPYPHSSRAQRLCCFQQHVVIKKKQRRDTNTGEYSITSKTFMSLAILYISITASSKSSHFLMLSRILKNFKKIGRETVREDCGYCD